MTLNPDDLPNDPALLKALLLQKQEQITVLQEQLFILRHHRFGASSEKHSVDQLGLFNEAEQDQPDSDEIALIEQAEAEIT